MFFDDNKCNEIQQGQAQLNGLTNAPVARLKKKYHYF